MEFSWPFREVREKNYMQDFEKVSLFYKKVDKDYPLKISYNHGIGMEAVKYDRFLVPRRFSAINVHFSK